MNAMNFQPILKCKGTIKRLIRIPVNAFGLSSDTSVAQNVRFYCGNQGNENVADKNTKQLMSKRGRGYVPKSLYDEIMLKLEEKANRIGELKYALKDAEQYQLLLGLVYRIDCLEKTLCPSNVTLPKPRKDRWIVILDQKNRPIIKEILDKLKKSEISVKLFSSAISQVCQERDEQGGRAAAIPLPNPVHDETIEKALRTMKIVPEKHVKVAVRVIVEPLQSGDIPDEKEQKLGRIVQRIKENRNPRWSYNYKL